jgi:PKD repeat protein
MNRKGIVIVIIAMVAIAMFVSTAMAITVDGDGDDWIGLPAAGLDTAVDADGVMELPANPCPYKIYILNWSSGYDMADFAMYYNASTDTLYFKINLSGVPGDTDGDYNPDSCTYCSHTGTGCNDSWETWPRAIADNPGVRRGAYIVRLDVDGDDNEDYWVVYTKNRVWVKDSEDVDHSDNFTLEGSIGHGPWSAANVSNVVEMSVHPAHNMSGFGMCWNLIIKEVSCGTYNDYLAEDPINQFIANWAPVPIPNATKVCYCTNTTFNGSDSYDPDGEIVSWKWDFGDGNTSSGVTTSHHYGDNGTYTVTLTVTDDYGFVCSNTTIIEVYENPTANFTATEVHYCTDTEFTDATIGGTPPYTYRWDFNNNGTYELVGGYPNPTWHYPAPGDYTARLNVTDNNSCANNVTRPVHVKEPVVNMLPVPIPNATHVCYCTYTEFDGSASYDPDGTIVSYEWDFGDGHTGSGVKPSHHYNAPNGRTYAVTLTVTDDFGIKNSSTIDVDVYENPTAKAHVSDYVVTLSGGTPLYRCTWNIGGTAYSGPGPHTVTISKLTIATLDVLDAHDCPGTDSVTVRIKHPPGAGGAAVPALSPFGIATLVGLLGLIGAGMIRKRR